MAAAAAIAGPSAYIANIGEGTVSVVDVATRTEIKKIGVGINPTSVAVTPDGRTAYVTNRDIPDHAGSVSIVDTATNTVTATLNLGGAPYGVAVTPDGSHVYVAKHHARQIAVISTATNTVVREISVPIKPYQLAIAPDGSTVYATCQDVCNTLVSITTATDAVASTYMPGGAQFGLDLTPDSRKLYVSSRSEITVLDAKTGVIQKSIAADAFDGGVVVSPSGDKVYVGTSSGNVTVISTSTDTVVQSIPAGSVGGLRGIAITSDGAAVFVPDYHNNRVAVIDTASNTLSATVPVGMGPFTFGKFIQRERYNFTGFFQPVDNAPTANKLRAGSAVPIKFSLGEDKGLNILASESPSSRRVSCDASAPVSTVEETVAAGGSALQYDSSGNQYIYVWKTDSGWGNTCREFNLLLKDGTVHKAIFHFSR